MSAPGMRTTRLIERALRERWPIPRTMRKPLIERLNEVVQDTASSPREVTSAAKAILQASKINLETITAAMKAQEHEELLERIRELERRSEASEPRGWRFQGQIPTGDEVEPSHRAEQQAQEQPPGAELNP
jgi:hypothetical protein